VKEKRSRDGKMRRTIQLDNSRKDSGRKSNNKKGNKKRILKKTYGPQF